MAEISVPHQSRAAEIQAMFDRIAPVYDELNQNLSLGLHRIWKRMAVLWSEAQTGDFCLDVCCGSGDLAFLLARQVGAMGTVYGVDFAEAQLAIARQRTTQLAPAATMHWQSGDALALPFTDSTFDAVTMGYGLRNLTDIPQGLRELCRVLKPGAKVAILDFHQPESAPLQQFQRWYLQRIVVPSAQRLGMTAEYEYLSPSIEAFPRGSMQVQLAHAAGFSQAVHYSIAAGLMGVLVATR